MPRGDATGPMGMGPMTGRGAGYCAGFGMPGSMNNAGGRGFGMGFGRGAGFGDRGGRGGGFGFRNRFLPLVCRVDVVRRNLCRAISKSDPEIEKSKLLIIRAEMLQSEMDAIKKRLEEMNIKAQKK